MPLDNEKEVFQDIEYSNTTVSKPLPDKVNDIDTKNHIYDNIIDAQEKGTLNANDINSFTSISRSRDEVYKLLDMMGEDPIISSALEIYASDATEPNDQGRILWVESDDSKVSGAVEQILDAFNVDKNAYSQIYSLCKYGDIYLKLYRNSEFNIDSVKSDLKRLNEDVNLSEEEKKKLKESIILRMYSKNDRYAEYAEMVKNPAEVFDLIKFGKTCGYIRTHINTNKSIVKQNEIIPQWNNNLFRYNLEMNDVDIYGATEFVHGCIENDTDRIEEEISLTTDDQESSEFESGKVKTGMTFSVKRGKSILYDSFKVWRELSLLENSVLLNRLTRSAIIRTINIEVGDMGKTQVETLLRRVKSMIEQKASYNVNNSMQEYPNAGPVENILYFPTHDGKGQVSTDEIGGQVDPGELTDLDYWKKKLFASLGIPGQYLGDTDDNTGFNGGTSLSLISSRYAKRIRHVQNAFIQLYTDAVNLVLLDRGLKDYINKFSLNMQSPSTQEERDRKDNLSNEINIVRETMGLFDEIEDKQARLEILKSLLSNVITNTDVLDLIQEEIDKLEETSEIETTDGGSDELDFGGGDLGGGDLDLGGGSDELPDLGDIGGEEGGEEIESEPLDLGGETVTEEPPAENFYNGGGQILNETNDLPSFADMGMSFMDVR